MTKQTSTNAKPTRIKAGPVEGQRRFRWVIEVEVDESWVADGFDLDDERVHDMMAHTLRYAYGHEIGGRVLRAPDPAEIRKAQGGTA